MADGHGSISAFGSRGQSLSRRLCIPADNDRIRSGSQVRRQLDRPALVHDVSHAPRTRRVAAFEGRAVSLSDEPSLVIEHLHEGGVILARWCKTSPDQIDRNNGAGRYRSLAGINHDTLEADTSAKRGHHGRSRERPRRYPEPGERYEPSRRLGCSRPEDRIEAGPLARVQTGVEMVQADG